MKTGQFTIKKFMPEGYTPDGGPYFYMADQSGQMQRIVAAFFEGHSLTVIQVEILRQYFQHWIDCPAWDRNPEQDQRTLEFLRFDIQTLHTLDRLHLWYRKACELGIDPL